MTLKDTKTTSPTIYKISYDATGTELVATPTWCDPATLPKGYTSFVSYILGDLTYIVGFNSATMAADTYELAKNGDGLTQKSTTVLGRGYQSLSLGILNKNQYMMGYDQTSGAFDFYLIGSDLSLMQVTSFTGPTELTTTSLFGYRGALYFVGYNSTNGSVAYYQVTTTATQSVAIQQIWSDTWAQGWMRFTFFQMAMENFFFKSNPKYNNVNIDHIMDDPSTGSHPVGTHLPLSQDLQITQSFYLNGDVFFTTYQTGGATTLNRFLASGQGWVSGKPFDTFAGVASITPLYLANDTYLLFY